MHNRVVRAIAVSMMLAGVSRAQAPAPAPTDVATVGFMHAIHATDVLEKTLAFYTEVFGLSGPVQPFANQAVPILTDSPGVTLKVSMLRLPGEGFNFELTEFSNVARTPAQPQIWDPGAPHMKILVRDIGAGGRRGAQARRADHHHLARTRGPVNADRQRDGLHVPRSRRLHRRGRPGGSAC